MGSARSATAIAVAVLVLVSLVQPLMPTRSASAATCPSFTALTPVASTGSGQDIAIGAYTNDDALDVAVANFGVGLDKVSMLQNSGSGALLPPVDSPGGGPSGSLGQFAIATADFDENGRLDLAAVKLWEDSVSVLLDDGFGTFRPHARFSTGTRPFDVVVGDFDGDGHSDIAVSNFLSSSVSVFFGDGTGDFPASASVPVGNFPKSLAVGDLDLDGLPEIVVAEATGVHILYMFNRAQHKFSSTLVAVPGNPTALAIAPMNADQFPDIVVADGSVGSLRVLTNKGTTLQFSTTFTAGAPISTGSSFPAAVHGIAAGLLDSDDNTDVAVLVANPGAVLPSGEPAVRVLTGDGKGGLAPAASIVVGRDPEAIELADMNGDGALDVVVADNGDGVYVAKNDCAAAIALDLQATGIEVVQVVQDAANSVPLIESKRTVVRGYAKSTRPAAGVTARLISLDGSGSVIGSLLPVNPLGRITVKPNPSRAALDDSFRFELPDAWTHGTLRLRLEVNPGGIPNETTSANNAISTSVIFVAARTLKVTFVDYRWQQCDKADVDTNSVFCRPDAPLVGFSDPFPETEYPALESELRRKFPVAVVRVKRVEVQDAGVAVPRTFVIGPQSFGDLFSHLTALRQSLSTSDPGTIFIWLNRAVSGGVAFDIPASDALLCCADVVAHEVGHDLGRRHTLCDGSEGGPDPAYPYAGGKIGGPTGNTDRFFGYAVPDSSAQSYRFGAVIASTTGDEMGYCRPRWPSDYSLKIWQNEIQTRSAFIDPVGDFLVVAGRISSDGKRGTLDEVRRVPQVATLTPIQTGPYRVRLQDAGAATLAEYPVTPFGPPIHEGQPDLLFDGVFNWVAGTRRVALVDAVGTELAARSVSASAPIVATISQNGGTTLPSTGTITVSWSGTDTDGDPLTASVLYSNDAGASWSLLASDLKATTFSFDAASLTGTKGLASGRFRVLLSDGVQNTSADTAAFVVPGQAPTVRIASPLQGARFELGQSITLETVALDAEDGVLDGTSVAWSSNLDGALGNGRLLVARLSEGTHTLTVTATDSDGRSTSSTSTVTVRRGLTLGGAPVANAGPDVAGAEGARLTLNGSGSSDPDGDALAYSWQIVAAPVDDVSLEDPGTPSPSFVAPDDGVYTLRLTVSDGLNPAVSDDVNVTIANVAAAVTIAAPTNAQLFPAGPVTVKASFTDPGVFDEHACRINWDLDQPTLLDAGAVSDAARTCTATRTLGAGVYTIQVAIDDGDGGIGTATVQAVVYDPSAGFVTGGGRIQSAAGAFVTNPSATGVATFGFSLRYPRGAAVPSGQTEFQFRPARLDFHGSNYEWLVVAGAKAQFRGTGTLNGVGGYSFIVTVTDSDIAGGGAPDRFRIRIWNAAGVVYDNVPGAPDDIDAANPSALTGGSIVVHQ